MSLEIPRIAEKMPDLLTKILITTEAAAVEVPERWEFRGGRNMEIAPSNKIQDRKVWRRFKDERDAAAKIPKGQHKYIVHAQRWFESFAGGAGGLQIRTVPVSTKRVLLPALCKLHSVRRSRTGQEENRPSVLAALIGVGEDNLDVFSSPAVYAIIEYKYRVLAGERSHFMLIMYTLLLLSLLLFVQAYGTSKTMLIEEYPPRGRFRPVDYQRLPFLCLTMWWTWLQNLYFLAQECKQLYVEGLGYLSSGWNKIDSAMAGMLFSVPFLLAFFLPDEVIAVATLLAFLKMLYFFRSFESLSLLITTVSIIMDKMRPFLIVLGVVSMGFAAAFYTLDTRETYFGLYHALWSVFQILFLGDLEGNEFTSPVEFFLLGAFLIVIVVVMFNMLIAIINEEFLGAQERGLLINRLEKARMINEHEEKMTSGPGSVDLEPQHLHLLVPKEEDSVVSRRAPAPRSPCTLAHRHPPPPRAKCPEGVDPTTGAMTDVKLFLRAFKRDMDVFQNQVVDFNRSLKRDLDELQKEVGKLTDELEDD